MSSMLVLMSVGLLTNSLKLGTLNTWGEHMYVFIEHQACVYLTEIVILAPVNQALSYVLVTVL